MPNATFGDTCEDNNITNVVSMNGGRLTLSFADGVIIENGDMIVHHGAIDYECSGEVAWVEIPSGTFSVSREPTSGFVTVGRSGEMLFEPIPISEL